MLHALRRIAQQEGLSMAEVIRQALDRFIAEQQGGNKLPSFLGMGRSGRQDVAERCEELLWQAESPAQKVAR